MARTETEIKSEIDELEKLLSSGASSISIDGTTTSFRSSAEINARIAQLKRELDDRNGRAVTGIYKNVSMSHGGNL